MDAVVETSGLTKRYGRTVAVGDNRGRVLLLDVSGGGPARVVRRVTLAENDNWRGIPSPQVIGLEFSPGG